MTHPQRPKVRRPVRMWEWSAALNNSIQCFYKKPKHVVAHPVLVIDRSKDALEGLVEKVAEVLGREDYMQSEDQEEYRSTARAVLRAIGLGGRGK